MSTASDRLEDALCAAYAEETELYARAVALSGSAAIETTGPGGPWLPELLELLDRVAAIETRVAAVKAEWQRQGQPPGAALQRCLARVAELLRMLACTIDAATGQAEARRGQLLPQLEEFVRVRRMHDAYQRAAQAR